MILALATHAGLKLKAVRCGKKTGTNHAPMLNRSTPKRQVLKFSFLRTRSIDGEKDV